MTNDADVTLAEFASTQCTVFFWLGDTPNETFASLAGAVRHVIRHRSLSDSAEIFVHSTAIQPLIVCGRDLAALMNKVAGLEKAS